MSFKSSFTKERTPEQPINQELTENFRNRLHNILSQTVGSVRMNSAFNNAKMAENIAEFQKYSFSNSNDVKDFFQSCEDKTLLSYLEHVFAHLEDTDKDKRWIELKDQVEDLLETEGILWKIETGQDGRLRARTVSSEVMEDSVKNVRELALDEKWREPLEPYLKALEDYSDGDFSYRIMEKLNIAIENVLKKICVDELSLTSDRDSPSGKYVQLLRDEGFFENNNIMQKELDHILNATDMMRKKIEGDRKRHDDIGRNYATLIFHQSSAFIYFLINEYEGKYA